MLAQTTPRVEKHNFFKAVDAFKADQTQVMSALIQIFAGTKKNFVVGPVGDVFKDGWTDVAKVSARLLNHLFLRVIKCQCSANQSVQNMALQHKLPNDRSCSDVSGDW